LTYYLDTSLLVAALTPEARTGRVHAWLEEYRTDHLGLSDWTVTEFASALSLKVRTGHLDVHQRRKVDDVLKTWLDGSLIQIPVSRRDFAEAARMLHQHDTGLRAGDALHLAMSTHHNARLVTLDRRLAAAADALDDEALLL
jgi:predicted nucleic acid-binding protein